jgi:hypothetical protein
MRAWILCVLIVATAGAASPVVAESTSEQPLATTLARVGGYVRQYYGRAQRVVAEEDVTLQPLDANLSFQGFPRRVRNELRIDWDPTATDADDRARVVRTLVKTAGPSLFDPGEDDCADPQTLTPEPLAFLLPDSQSDWVFTPGKPATIDGRQTVTFEYVQRHPHPVEISGTDNCVFVDLSGRTKGRVWADPETGEVLRVDERLEGPVDIRVPRKFQKKVAPRIEYERQTSSVRYKPVRFTDPDETLLLPSSIEAMSVYRGRSVTRLRTTQEFSNYRRFVTETRVLGE